MAGEYMLTTIDNPFNPWDDFERWFLYDATHGYNTCGKIDRLAPTSKAFTEEENNEIVDEAISDIIETDFEDIYVRIKEDEWDAFVKKYQTP